jgi:hypothetical protein
MTSQQHETIADWISSLNVKRYQDLLDTPLTEAERQTIQTLLRAEELWVKHHTPPFCVAPFPADHSRARPVAFRDRSGSSAIPSSKKARATDKTRAS